LRTYEEEIYQEVEENLLNRRERRWTGPIRGIAREIVEIGEAPAIEEETEDGRK
jgi:hypothetical protein